MGFCLSPVHGLYCQAQRLAKVTTEYLRVCFFLWSPVLEDSRRWSPLPSLHPNSRSFQMKSGAGLKVHDYKARHPNRTRDPHVRFVCDHDVSVNSGLVVCSNSQYGDGSQGRARHSVRAVRSLAPQDWRARSDALYQPDVMRIAVLCARLLPVLGRTLN